MFFNKEDYKESIYQFDKNEQIFKKPFSVFKHSHFDEDQSDTILLNVFGEKKGFVPKCNFLGKIVFNQKGNILIQPNSIEFFMTHLNTLVGDKFNYMEINDTSLLSAYLENQNIINSKKSYLREKIPFEHDILKLKEKSDSFNDNIRKTISEAINIEKENNYIFELIEESKNIEIICLDKKNNTPLLFDYNQTDSSNFLIIIPDSLNDDLYIKNFISDFIDNFDNVDILAVSSTESNQQIARKVIYTDL